VGSAVPLLFPILLTLILVASKWGRRRCQQSEYHESKTDVKAPLYIVAKRVSKSHLLRIAFALRLTVMATSNMHWLHLQQSVWQSCQLLEGKVL